jgi:hypothetical protein
VLSLGLFTQLFHFNLFPLFFVILKNLPKNQLKLNFFLDSGIYDVATLNVQTYIYHGNCWNLENRRCHSTKEIQDGAPQSSGESPVYSSLDQSTIHSGT